MVDCYQQLDAHEQLETALLDLMQKYQGVTPVLSLADHYVKTAGEEKATQFLTEQLQKRASFKGLNALLALNKQKIQQMGTDIVYFEVFQNLITELLKGKPKLRCRKCGFGAQSLHWQCPSCKHWGVVKPIYGLESE